MLWVVLTVIALLVVGIPVLVVWSIEDDPPYFWQDEGISEQEAVKNFQEEQRRLLLIETYDPADRQTR